MTPRFAGKPLWACLYTVTIALVAAMTTGCTTVAMMGVKVVGDAVHTADVNTQSKELIGQPVQAADTAFGQRVNTFEETRTKRQMMTYRVKGDVLSKFRWVVEAENDKIVALAKTQFDADGGKDIIKKALLKNKVIGKSPTEIQADKHFEKLILVLRNRTTENLVRVYDVRGATDLLGARYCVLDFDDADVCREIRLVGVPASAGTGEINR